MVNRGLVAIGIGVLAIAIGGLFVIQSNTTNDGPTQTITKLTWERSGGFAGVADELIIDADGFTTYESRFFGNSEILLDPVEVSSLMADAEDVVTGRIYTATDGMADFFTYRLTIQTPLISEQVEWVDEWASAETLPAQLVELQGRIENIVLRIEAQGGASEEERASAIAESFVIQGPTFGFDGIPDSLEVTDLTILESFPPQYRITISFESTHAGYGNREGQALAQVITAHEIVVTVVRDAVISAVIDMEWDEVEQVPRVVQEPPLSSGPPPQLVIKYSGAEYKGLQSTYCWGALCVDYISVEMREDLSQLVPIEVINGAQLSIGVEDHALPERFFIQFYSVRERSWLESITTMNDSFNINLAPGEYLLLVSTAWEMEGDTSNIFNLTVAEP